MGALGLTFGIIATILSLIVFGLPYGAGLGIIAIIFSVIGRKIAALSNQPSGVATAGMVLGIIATSIGATTCVSCAICVGEEAYFDLVETSFDKFQSFCSNALSRFGL